jgi:hypothetical protein
LNSEIDGRNPPCVKSMRGILRYRPPGAMGFAKRSTHPTLFAAEPKNRKSVGWVERFAKPIALSGRRVGLVWKANCFGLEVD